MRRAALIHCVSCFPWCRRNPVIASPIFRSTPATIRKKLKPLKSPIGDGVTYYDVPQEYGVRDYRYTVVNGRTVLIDPHTPHR